jgi:hypothetical protein
MLPISSCWRTVHMRTVARPPPHECGCLALRAPQSHVYGSRGLAGLAVRLAALVGDSGERRRLWRVRELSGGWLSFVALSVIRSALDETRQTVQYRRAFAWAVQQPFSAGFVRSRIVRRLLSESDVFVKTWRDLALSLVPRQDSNLRSLGSEGYPARVTVPAEILRLLLKECPLEAIVVGGKGTGECGHRIQPESVECFDPKIKVAIGLRPDPLAHMTEM